MPEKCPHCKEEAIEPGMQLCPECFEDVKECPECGKFLKPKAPKCPYCRYDFSGGTPTAAPSESVAGISIGDSVRSNFSIDQSTHQTVIHGPDPMAKHMATAVGESCPICGRVAKDDYFHCKACGRDYICSSHQNPESFLCSECHAERLKRTAPGAISDGLLPGMKFSSIPAGSFMMGAPESVAFIDMFNVHGESPQHEVQLDAFEIMTTPVTQAMWKEVMGSNPSYYKYNLTPVESVSWEDTQEFIRRMNALDSSSIYRLPTEAEWEYACRAGTTTYYYNGDDESKLDEIAGCKMSDGLEIFTRTTPKIEGGTYEVGKRKPNAWGLYDMLGNVYEWCSDWFDTQYYAASPLHNPQGPSHGTERVIRGSAFFTYGITGKPPGSHTRAHREPSTREQILGFRLVRTMK